MSELHVVLGTGPLGRAVMEALATRERRVRLVNRSGQMASVPDSVEIVAGDLYQRDNVAALTEGTAVVYHCAQPGYTKWVEEFPPLTTAILDGVAQSGAKLIVGDNLYMYGDTRGAPIHEGLPNAARTRKGMVRAQVTKMALDAHQSGTVRVAIGRGSDFFWTLRARFDDGRASLLSGPGGQGRAAGWRYRCPPHSDLYRRLWRGVGHLGRTRGGAGANLACT
ncbi:MAG: NAD(P)H-binding protein [Caldilineaceae bacterium]|nr:NAD(P)H-binding protein [Caldilineaceae bacterium]